MVINEANEEKSFKLKMDVGPDGSLCHITSSAKDIVSNVKIIKVSENERLNTNEPEYKLVFIGEEEIDNESLSEESDEDTFEKELFHKTNVILSTENNEKDKEVKVQEVNEDPKNNKKKFHKKAFYGKSRSNNIRRGHKNYKSFGKGNFNSSGNVNKPYNRSNTNTSSQDISPWIHYPTQGVIIPYGNVSDYMYQQYPSSAKSIVNNSVYPSSAESIVKNSVTPGLLGDSPSSCFIRPHFQSSYQSNPYRHGQNFRNRDYSSSYQTVPNRQGTSPSLNYQNKHKKNKSWKRNQKRNQQDRRSNKTYFPY